MNEKINSDGISVVSVLELNDPHGIFKEGGFFILLQELVNLLETKSDTDKNIEKKVNKIHKDLQYINNTLLSVDSSVHIHNLIKLYEEGFIEPQEIKRLVNKFLEDRNILGED